MGELKPCPFCGDTAYVSGERSWWHVECLNCSIRMGNEPDEFRSKEEAIKAWNTRVLPEELIMTNPTDIVAEGRKLQETAKNMEPLSFANFESWLLRNAGSLLTTIEDLQRDKATLVHTYNELFDKFQDLQNKLTAAGNFKYEDVIAVANAIEENSIQREYQGDYGAHAYLYECMFCAADSPELNDLKHHKECPVLIAQDLLVGSEVQK